MYKCYTSFTLCSKYFISAHKHYYFALFSSFLEMVLWYSSLEAKNLAVFTYLDDACDAVGIVYVCSVWNGAVCQPLCA